MHYAITGVHNEYTTNIKTRDWARLGGAKEVPQSLLLHVAGRRGCRAPVGEVATVIADSATRALIHSDFDPMYMQFPDQRERQSLVFVHE